MAAHEGYPGHHVYNIILEKNLVKDKDWIEYTVYPLYSPQSLIADGTAVVGGKLLFPGDERIKFEKDVLFPIARLDTTDAELYYKALELQDKLDGSSILAARNYLDGDWTKEETLVWLQKFQLRTKERTEKFLTFIETYRSLSGGKKALTDIWAGGVSGLARSPSEEEVWFTASPGDSHLGVRAVDLAGRQRVLLAGLTDLFLFDLAREGRLLLGRATPRQTVETLVAGHATPQDVSLRESTVVRFVTPDGRTMLLSDQSATPYTAYLQRADGSPPVRLGVGDAYSLSPDERWVVALTTEAPSRILLHPTGPGESREIPNGQHILACDRLAVKFDAEAAGIGGAFAEEQNRSRLDL